MATAQSYSLDDASLADMIKAVAVDASRDADLVHLFLSKAGLLGTSEKPIRLPAAFLLRLGSALRLLVWETQGLSFHRAAGLPESREAVHQAVLSLSEPDADSTDFCKSVFRLSIQHFAWSGVVDLGADVFIDEFEEDALLDALADYLWAQQAQ